MNRDFCDSASKRSRDPSSKDMGAPRISITLLRFLDSRTVVASVVRSFLGRGFGIGSGGVDLFALRALVNAGGGVCATSVVALPGDLSVAPKR